MLGGAELGALQNLLKQHQIKAGSALKVPALEPDLRVSAASLAAGYLCFPVG